MGWMGPALGGLGNDIGKAKLANEQIEREQKQQSFENNLADFRTKLEERRIAAEEARNKAMDDWRKEQEKLQRARLNRTGRATPEEAKQRVADYFGAADWESIPETNKAEADAMAQKLMGTFTKTVGTQSKVKIKDDNSPTGWSWGWENTVTHQLEKLEPGAPPQNNPNEPVYRTVFKSVTDEFGNQTLKPVVEVTSKGKPVTAQQPSAGTGGVPAAKPKARQSGAGPANPSASADTPAESHQDSTYRAALVQLNNGVPWTVVTKGWKTTSGFVKWMSEHGIPIPTSAFAKAGTSGAGGTTANAIAGLDILEKTMFHDTPAGALYEGSEQVDSLKSAVSALDEHHFRLVQMWPLLQKYLGGHQPGGLMDANILNIVMQNLSPEERQYYTAMNQAVSSINGLRSFMGNPRYTEALAKRFISELPDPVTTPDAQTGQLKLARIYSEIKAARERLASGKPITEPEIAAAANPRMPLQQGGAASSNILQQSKPQVTTPGSVPE